MGLLEPAQRKLRSHPTTPARSTNEGVGYVVPRTPPNRMILEAGALRRSRRSEGASSSEEPSPGLGLPPRPHILSGRVNTAVGAGTAPSAGSSHGPTYRTDRAEIDSRD